jgi:hypothetical protein
MAVVAREAAHGRRLAGLLQLDAWVWGCQPGSGVDLLGLWCVVNTAALIPDLCFACSGAYDCGCFAKHNILA